MHLRQPSSATRATCLGLALSLSAAHTFAQSAGTQDPGLVMQEHLRRIEQSSRLPAARGDTEVSTPKPEAPASAANVRIDEIQFSRSELLEPQELQAIGQRYVGRTLGTGDIQQLLDDVAALYRNKGILTALPVLPRQDLTTGLMRILLVEGRLGNVRIKAPESADADWVRRWFDLAPNTVVRSEDLRERLVTFNNASDYTAQAQFVAGEEFGLSELAVEVAPADRVRGWAFYETTSGTGSNASAWLTAAGLRITPLTLQGGRLDTAAVITDTSRTVTGSLSIPVGTEGWRTGVAGTRSTTRLSLADQGLTVEGSSSALTWEVGRSWVLADPWVLATGVTIGRWTTHNSFYIDPTPDPISTRTARTKLSATAGLQHESAAARGSLRTTFTANLSHPGYAFGDLFGHWIQPFDEAGLWLWRIAGSVRAASRGSVSQVDQFQLGGSDTVRGFDPSAAAGERGSALQLELRHRLDGLEWGQVEAYVFMDSGTARSSAQRKQLESVGAGLQTRLASGLGLDLLASHQLGHAIGGRDRLMVRLVANW